MCDLTKYKNSLIAAKVTSRVTSRHVETEENTIKLLSIQPVTLFIEATRTLHQYKEGLLYFVLVVKKLSNLMFPAAGNSMDIEKKYDD